MGLHCQRQYIFHHSVRFERFLLKNIKLFNIDLGIFKLIVIIIGLNFGQLQTDQDVGILKRERITQGGKKICVNIKSDQLLRTINGMDALKIHIQSMLLS